MPRRQCNDKDAPEVMVPGRLIDWLAIGWFLVITYLSLAPLPEFSELHTNDKLHHIAAYAVLATLSTFHRRRSSTILVIVIMIVLYGGLIEWVQPLVNRHGELADFLANCAGVVLGLGVMLLMTWLGEWLENR